MPKTSLQAATHRPRRRALTQRLLPFLLLVIFSTASAQPPTTVDVCIYGGTSAGVIAAYTARNLGKTVLLIEPGRRLGGLSSGGLGYTDIGNKYAISGLALDFYRRVGRHYGKFEQWIFEPHVADSLFRDYIARAKVKVVYEHRLTSVSKQSAVISDIVIEGKDGTQRIKAAVFMDCTYEGDLMAKAGVSYVVGREGNAVYGETYNGVQVHKGHQFPDGVDPYVVEGDSASGLLWGIGREKLADIGTGDKLVQAYNFRICLSSDPANQLPITKPEGYDSTRYELLLRVLKKEPNRGFNQILKPDLMPNHKTDINNNGPFSTDMIGMSWDFAEADYARRAEIQREHELYNKGLLYFIGHDPRMPQSLRSEMLRWGYPKDEYEDNGNWTPQLYVREARRMVGSYVMTQANCEGRTVAEDGIGLAAYTMDSHNCQRVVVVKDGVAMVKNEGNVEIGGFPPYPIAYRSLLPKEAECTNLIVPVCLSASHIAYGSIRMEPVFMELGQSAAVAAKLAIDRHTAVQKVDVREVLSLLQRNPLADHSVPEVLMDNDGPGVQLTGTWKKETKGAFGHSMFTDDSSAPDAAKAVRFSPSLPKSGMYKVYMYLPILPGRSSSVTVQVFDGSQRHEQRIQTAAVSAVGQTSGEWIFVGQYDLKKNAGAHIAITNKGADGVVAADAVLFVPNR